MLDLKQHIANDWLGSFFFLRVNNITCFIYPEHCRVKLVDGFSKNYNLNKLVYYEVSSTISAAIEREKQIKGWNRKRKNKLIESKNPNWEDLSKSWNI